MIFQTNALGVMCVMVTIFVLLSHACMKQSVRVINGVFMANAKILNAGRKSKKFDNTYSHVLLTNTKTIVKSVKSNPISLLKRQLQGMP